MVDSVDSPQSSVRDGRLGNYGYIVTAQHVTLIGRPGQYASKLTRLIRYSPSPPHLVEPRPQIPTQYGQTVAEANTAAARLVEVWIRQQPDCDSV